MNYDKSELQGTEAEQLYKKIAIKNGYEIINSTIHENRNKHVDFIVRKDTITFTVDVKSLKRINSTDKYVDDSLICIELQNVNGGIGWLYGSEDKLAFFLREGICTVNREDVKNLFTTLNIDLTVPSIQSNRNKKKHIIYDRSQWAMKYNPEKMNDDRIIYILKEELLSLPHEIWSI